MSEHARCPSATRPAALFTSPSRRFHPCFPLCLHLPFPSFHRSASSLCVPCTLVRGRVNVHLLESARNIIKTGKTGRGKDLDYAIPPAVMKKIEELWTQAKLWHKVFGRAMLDAQHNEKEAEREAREAKRREQKAAEKAKAREAEERQRRKQWREEARANGEEIASSADEDETAEPASKAPLAAGSAAGTAGATAGSGGTPADEEDEEAAWLGAYQQQVAKEKVKVSFWRRDAAFIVDSDEEEEEGEGGDDGSDAGSEALEGNQRAKAAPIEWGRMNDQEAYDAMNNADHQRLRAATAGLPCIKQKLFTINTLLHKIESNDHERRAAPAASKQASSGSGVGVGGDDEGVAAMEEEESAVELIKCYHCAKTLDAGDQPLADRTLPKLSTGCHPLFCSALCITVHRSKHAKHAKPQAEAENAAPQTAAAPMEDDADDEEDDEPLRCFLRCSRPLSSLPRLSSSS